jgi:hypothetical protein
MVCIFDHFEQEWSTTMAIIYWRDDSQSPKTQKNRTIKKKEKGFQSLSQISGYNGD